LSTLGVGRKLKELEKDKEINSKGHNRKINIMIP